MAKFLYVPVPVAGHMAPALALLGALSARGHEVAMYTGERFHARVERAGGTPLRFQRAQDVEFERLNELFPERPKKAGLAQARFDLKTLMIDAAQDQLSDLAELTEGEEIDAVISDPMAPAGLFFAEQRSLPLAALNAMNLFAPSRDTAPDGFGLAPSSSPLGRVRNRLMGWLIHDVALRDVNRHLHRFRERMGLGRLPDNLMAMPFRLTQLFLQPTAPSFEYPRSDLPPQVHFIGALKPPPPRNWEKPQWWPRLEERRPVVLVTQGTVATDLDDLLVPTLEALSDDDVLVVAATGRPDAGDVAVRSENLIVEPFVPFDAIMPFTRVFVTNGGYGGIHFALTNGVPLVVAGRTEDKAETCARVGWSGVGIDLAKDRPTRDEIRSAVLEVLHNPAYRRRAEVLQDELAGLGGPALGAELLERLADTGELVVRA